MKKLVFITFLLFLNQFLFSQKIEKYIGKIQLKELEGIKANFVININNKDQSDSLQLFINKNAKINFLRINNENSRFQELEVKNDLPDVKKIKIKGEFPKNFKLEIDYIYPLTKIENKTFQYRKHWIEMNNFTAWFPFNRENNSFQYELEFQIPKNYRLTSVGKIKKRNSKWSITNYNNTDDIPIVISDNFNIFKSKNNKISFYTIDLSEKQRNQIADDSEIILDYYNRNFGSPSENNLIVAINPFSNPWSYTRKGYISLSLKNDYTEKDKLRLAHEIGHLWWSNNKIYGNGNDWLNEGFAEYSSLIWYKKYLSKVEYSNLLIKYKKAFDSEIKITKVKPEESAFFEITYLKGAYFLYLLGEKMGEPEMNKFLHKVNKMKINNTLDLVTLLKNEYSKYNITELLNEI